MATTTEAAVLVLVGVNGRAFLRHRDLTLKQRNAARKKYEAEGWTCSTFGSNRNGWTVQGYKGEAPFVIRTTIRIGSGQEPGVTPLYRIAGERDDYYGMEFIDGRPERGDDN